MSQPNGSMYVVLWMDDMTQAEVDEINRITRELGAALEQETEAVGSVSLSGKEDLPEGTKAVLEVLLAEQVVLQVAPIVVNWVLGRIDATIKAVSAHLGRRVKAKVVVGSREVRITPATTPQELTKAAHQVKAASELSPNRRFALVIGNSSYQDQRLPDLKSAAADAERFAAVLSDPNLGAFTQVATLIDKTHDVIEQTIEKFFQNKLREDLLLLYFSGHGIKSQSGQLFLAAGDTFSDYLRSTGVAAGFIRENMAESGSQRQILILDCCYGGAIVEGAKSGNAVGQPVDSIMSFMPSGFGRIIITASEAMQYAFDGKHVEGQTQNSLFTRYLIEGLQTGKADSDNDGLVDVNELYQYAYKHVTPQQTPNISSTSQEGRMYMGFNPNPSIQLAQLSEPLIQAMRSETRLHRQGAVSELSRLLRSPDPSMALAAETALRKMASDDSRSVADMAQEALDQHFRARTVVMPEKPVPQGATPKSSVPEPAAFTPPSQPVETPPISSHPNVLPEKTASGYSTPPSGMRNENAGGCLNVLLPGLAHLLVGNWQRALLTFILVTIAGTILGGIATIDLGLCSGPILIGMLIYLFIEGRKAFRRDNQLKS